MKSSFFGAIVLALILSSCGSQSPRVYFISPADGATVGTEVQIKMGVEGMKVNPAGELVEGTGHHHLIIDGQPIPKGTPVPANTTHIHYGKGQTETTLTLSPGKHTITMQFADGYHQSYGPEMSKTITVTVQ